MDIGKQPEETRVIIGESERAGLPISAPYGAHPDLLSDIQVRWLQRENHFTLQVMTFDHDGNENWTDVPCVKEA